KSDLSLINAVNNFPSTEFVGYEALEIDAKVLRLMKVAGQIGNIGVNSPLLEQKPNNDTIESVALLERDFPGRFSTGEIGEVILDRSPFYSESGGQVSDHGHIEWP